MADNSEREIRAALGRLCTKGVAPYRITDHARVLLDLQVVHRRVDPAACPATDAQLVQALVEYLREAVARLEWSQHRILLEIVLDLEEKYIEKTATQRRAIAGERFRGGRDVVTAGTIRQHHEGKALDKLTRIVLADEARAGAPQSLFP